MAEIVHFTAQGPAKSLASAIEAYALAQGHVSALVVPWESSATTLNMAVTAVRAEGWAIEHTNLGTVTLTDNGGTSTRVVVSRADAGSDAGSDADGSRQRLAAVFETFARQLKARFEAAA